MMVSGMKAKCIEKVNFHGQTDNRMKENMSMILNKALEYFNSPMIWDVNAISKMDFNMVKGKFIIRTKYMMQHGRMAKKL